MKALPGSPHPLGATWDGQGVNFALFSANAEAVSPRARMPDAQIAATRRGRGPAIRLSRRKGIGAGQVSKPPYGRQVGPVLAAGWWVARSGGIVRASAGSPDGLPR